MPGTMNRLKLFVLLISLLTAGLLLVLFLGLQDTHPEFSAEERDWLRRHGRNVEVLFGYQAPPNAYTDSNGQYVGLLVDYFREIERNMGLDVRFHMFDSWDLLMSYSRDNGGFLIVGIAETAERRKFLRFTEPFIKVPYVIVTRDSSSVGSMDDLGGRTVCTVRGYAVNEYLQDRYPNIDIAPTKDNLEGLRAVSTGQCDAMIVNQAYASYLIESQGLANLHIAGESGYMNYLSAATSRSDDMLFNIVSKAVAHIPRARHKELFREWVYQGSGYVHLTERGVTLLWAAFLFVLVGGVVFWLLLRSLRGTVRRQTVTIRRDYERLKEAEQSLREQGEQLRGALERLTFHVHNTPLAVVEWDSHGQVRGWSPRAEEIFGWSESEVLGKRSEEWRFVPEGDRDLVQRGALDLQRGAQNQTVSENRNYAKTGEVLFCRWYNSALRDADGALVSVLSLVENITEGKRAEQELIRAKEAAEAASAAKSEFLANMSHEIRTPLNGIQGMLQLLQTTGLDAPQEEYVDKALGSTRRLSRLLGDILHLTLLESGRVRLEDGEFSPQGVLHSVQELFEPTATDSELDFIVQTDSNLPPRLRGDGARVRQLLTNLAGNAVKFTPPGGSVRLAAHALPYAPPGRTRVLLIVGDSGQGMSSEAIRNLLDTFVPGEVAYRRHYEGAGLGLAIVVRLVRLLGGSLCIASQEDQGTEVFCSLLFENT
ncbi:MAG: transporter substrate-binding domain-containing protein [Desulfovibrio sp.]